MKGKFFVFLAVFLSVLGSCVVLSAQSVSQTLEQAEEETGYASFFESIPEDCLDWFASAGIDLDSEAAAPDLSQMLRFLFSVISSVLSEHLPLISLGIGLILLFRLLSSVCSSHPQLVEALGFCSAVSSGVCSFAAIEGVLEQLTDVTEQISSFLTAALPVIGAAQVWSGSQAGASVVSVTVPVILNLLTTLISTVFYPLCWFCYTASLTGFVRGPISLRPVVSSVKRFCVRGVEILSGLSVGVFCVQRAAVASANSVARKGIRFALIQLLPLAGNSLTDGIETVYACGKSICGRVGVLCVFVAAALLATPCILGFCYGLIYSFLASAGGFLGVPLLVDFFSDLRDTFSMMTCFAVCALGVLASALLLLTGG